MKRIVDLDYVIQEGDWVRTNYDLTLSHYASKTLMGLAGRKVRDCGDVTIFERLDADAGRMNSNTEKE